ncbi:MAG: 30S ribosomal protein S9 [Candidatus Yanofskybacteria bacterium]|nr:30S ribosomal protein S9 [Candidatus Yanofskybacteria bacterium]
MPKKTTTKPKPKKTSLKKPGVKAVPKQTVTGEPRQGREIIELETKEAAAPIEIKKPTSKEKYYEAMGGRKESVARVRLYTKKATDVTEGENALIIVNGKDYREYFSDAALWEIIESPLKKLKSTNRFKVTVVVHGGGKSGQAGAIKHGIARTLVDFDQNFRKKLKKSGYLTRDPRAKERRKYGLKKARKAPRWAKR